MTDQAATTEKAAPTLNVAPSPHVSDPALTTQRMMLDVLIALTPAVVMSMIVFGLHAAGQISICVFSCVVAEGVFSLLRRRRPMPYDLSAVVTGVILALSLPWSAPWYVGVIGSVVAVGIAKVLFGGLGQNLFNPAMVGRAFVMMCFATVMGASAYKATPATGVPDAVTQATPLAAMQQARAAARQARRAREAVGVATTPEKIEVAKKVAEKAQRVARDSAKAAVRPLLKLVIGNINGSLGETSALACLLGGLYLCVRRTASWQIPVSVVGAVVVIAGLMNLADPDASFTVLHHVCGGALLFGAVFIATDPVTSPLTLIGKIIFGAGIGALVMLFRTFSGYPEGVMFAVLLMNACVPLINRRTIPTPIGGPMPAAAAK